jgi:hypothetical protein
MHPGCNTFAVEAAWAPYIGFTMRFTSIHGMYSFMHASVDAHKAGSVSLYLVQATTNSTQAGGGGGGRAR